MISTIWEYGITMVCISKVPSQFCEISAVCPILLDDSLTLCGVLATTEIQF